MITTLPSHRGYSNTSKITVKHIHIKCPDGFAAKGNFDLMVVLGRVRGSLKLLLFILRRTELSVPNFTTGTSYS